MALERGSESSPRGKNKTYTNRITRQTSKVRTTEYKKMKEKLLNNPDSVTSEEFLSFQSAIGYRRAMSLLTEGRRRKELSRHGTLEKASSTEKAQALQRKSSSMRSSNSTPVSGKRENNTGLPDGLKAGIESLSGIDISDVKVHYNSNKPTEVGALAYTKGTDIYIAPGQEKNLPHEAWHAVQQIQGRVRPTGQIKDIAVNDNRELENEAGRMGLKALNMKNSAKQPDKVQTALSASALKRSGKVLQRAFAGFTGVGWALDNIPVPGAMDIFPGGANNAAGGQQGGATVRVIDIASTNAYAPPQALGGFTHFSNIFGNKILYRPTGGARYTHLHVINGKLHGPGTPDNLVLGSPADNNVHRARVEDHIRNGLPGINTATQYSNDMIAAPPFFYNAATKKAYWNKPGLVMIGAQAAAVGKTINVGGGVMIPYTHWADSEWVAGKQTRWANYSVNPVYGGVLSQTILKNIAAVYRSIHENEADDNLEYYIINMPLAAAHKKKAMKDYNNIKTVFNGIVTYANLAAGGVNATLTNANNAAQANAVAYLQPVLGINPVNTYIANMNKKLIDMANFALWAKASFPTSLNCDANLYRASYDPANKWLKRTEAQEQIAINQI